MATLQCNLGDKPTLDLYTGVNITEIRVAAATGALALQLNAVSGFNDGDVLLVNCPGLGPGEMPDRLTIATGGINTATLTVTFTPALIRSHAIGQEVWEARNPTTVALTGTDPDGTPITKALADYTQQAVGYHTYAHLMSKLGTWRFRTIVTGVDAGTAEWEIEVS